MNLTSPPLVRRDEHRGWMMDVSDHGGPLRTPDSGEQRVTPLELFFDLVFVFAVTQLSHLLLGHLSIRGALETLFLLLAVWWVWVYTAWFTNWFDPERLPVRLVLVAVMLASLLMSVAIPDAFGERGLMFALAFVAIQVGRTAFAVLTLGASHPLSGTFWRILAWLVAGGVLWVAGGTGRRRGALRTVAARVGRGLRRTGDALHDAGVGELAHGGVDHRGDALRREVPAVHHYRTGRVDPGDRHDLRRDRSVRANGLCVRGGLPRQRRAVVDLLRPQRRGSSRGLYLLRGPWPVGSLSLHLLPPADGGGDHRGRRGR